jgi:hypothetical protein
MIKQVLFKSFEEEKFLISCPILLEKREVKLIDDSILLWVLFDVGEARGAIVSLIDHDFGGLGDIAFALIALYFIGWIENILNEMMGT